jgi:hypothetical protein
VEDVVAGPVAHRDLDPVEASDEPVGHALGLHAGRVGVGLRLLRRAEPHGSVHIVLVEDGHLEALVGERRFLGLVVQIVDVVQVFGLVVAEHGGALPCRTQHGRGRRKSTARHRAAAFWSLSLPDARMPGQESPRCRRTTSTATA